MKSVPTDAPPDMLLDSKTPMNYIYINKKKLNWRELKRHNKHEVKKKRRCRPTYM